MLKTIASMGKTYIDILKREIWTPKAFKLSSTQPSVVDARDYHYQYNLVSLSLYHLHLKKSLGFESYAHMFETLLATNYRLQDYNNLTPHIQVGSKGIRKIIEKIVSFISFNII